MEALQKVEQNQNQPTEVHTTVQTTATVIKWDTTPLRRLMEERKNLIVKINDVYEITRPLALELLKMLREQALSSGISLREKTEVLHKDNNSVIVEVRIAGYLFRDKDGNLIPETEQPILFEVSEIGEGYKEERGKNTTYIRTAYTRALKRALERLVGEDFINQVILDLFNTDKPASEKQKNLIRKLLKELEIPEKAVEKKYGKIDDLTSKQANEIISKLLQAKAKNSRET